MGIGDWAWRWWGLYPHANGPSHHREAPGPDPCAGDVCATGWLSRVHPFVVRGPFAGHNSAVAPPFIPEGRGGLRSGPHPWYQTSSPVAQWLGLMLQVWRRAVNPAGFERVGVGFRHEQHPVGRPTPHVEANLPLARATNRHGCGIVLVVEVVLLREPSALQASREPRRTRVLGSRGAGPPILPPSHQPPGPSPSPVLLLSPVRTRPQPKAWGFRTTNDVHEQ
jgi:hypothetical protein